MGSYHGGGVFAGKSDKSGGKMPTGKAASNPMLEILAEVGPDVALIGAFLAISTLLHLSLTAGLCAASPSGPYPPAGTVKTVNTVDLQGKLSSNGTDISLTVPVSGVVSERPDDPPKIARDHAAVCSTGAASFLAGDISMISIGSHRADVLQRPYADLGR